jgi:6-phosphofructokinase 1
MSGVRDQRRVAVLTSGGDAPGMNAAIRAVVRTASSQDIETYGVVGGFAGLLQGNFRPLDDRGVGGILQRGGTMLGTSRYPEFLAAQTQRAAVDILERAGVRGVVVIGGNGSQCGTLALHRLGFPAVGVASTIDNDLAETEITIGVDTALNTAIGCIDRLKDTATSHHRAFVVETMGRHSGYLALIAAISTGAELAVVPEAEVTLAAIADDVRASYARGKVHYIAVMAEGATPSAHAVTVYLSRHASGFEARLSVLGHVQRGGTPTVRDRLLASQLGAAAVEALARGRSGVLLGWRDHGVSEIPLADAVAPCRKVTPELLSLAAVLGR